MRRMLLIGLSLSLLSVVGCSTDPREPIVQEMVRQIDIAGTKLKSVREKVDSALAQAKKKAEKDNREVKAADLTKEELKSAVEAVKGLKEVGAAYVALNRQMQNISEPITPAQQDRYAADFGNKLQSEMVDLGVENEKLAKALQAAEAINPDSVKELNDKLAEAFGDFASVAKRS